MSWLIEAPKSHNIVMKNDLKKRGSYIIGNPPYIALLETCGLVKYVCVKDPETNENSQPVAVRTFDDKNYIQTPRLGTPQYSLWGEPVPTGTDITINFPPVTTFISLDNPQNIQNESIKKLPLFNMQ